MKVLNKLNLEIGAIMAGRNSAYATSGIFLGEDNSVSTDGRILCIVDYPDTDPETMPVGEAEEFQGKENIILQAEEAKTISKQINRLRPFAVIRRTKETEIEANTFNGSLSRSYINTLEGSFPKYQDVIPNDNKTKYRVNLGPEYLEKIAKAAKKAGALSVEFNFQAFEVKNSIGECNDAIKFRFKYEHGGQPVTGVLMPVYSK